MEKNIVNYVTLDNLSYPIAECIDI